MSVVIAVKDGDRFVIGADTQGTIGDWKTNSASKIWPVHDLDGAVMGIVGTLRAGQVLKYANLFDKNNLPDEITTDYVVNQLIPTMVLTLEQSGISCNISKISEDDAADRFAGHSYKCAGGEKTTDEPRNCFMPVNIIFAWKDKAWYIHGDLAVNEIEDYHATGSGLEVATGVLFATPERDVFDRIKIAIAATSNFVTSVNDNIEVIATVAHEDDIARLQSFSGPEENVVAEPVDDAGKKKGKKSSQKIKELASRLTKLDGTHGE